MYFMVLMLKPREISMSSLNGKCGSRKGRQTSESQKLNRCSNVAGNKG